MMSHLLMLVLLALFAASTGALCKAPPSHHHSSQRLTPIRRAHANKTATLSDIFHPPVQPNEDADPAEEPDPNDPDTYVDVNGYDTDFNHDWTPEQIVPSSQWHHFCHKGRILCWHGIPTNFLRDLISMCLYLGVAILGPMILGALIWKGCVKWIWIWARKREEGRVRSRFVDFDVRERRIRRMKLGMSVVRGGRTMGGATTPQQQQNRDQLGRPSTSSLRGQASNIPTSGPRPRTVIGSTGRGNRPLTIINTTIGPNIPRCSVLLSPRSSAAAFGYGAGLSRINLLGPRAMPMAVPQQQTQQTSANETQPTTTTASSAPTLAVPMTDPLLSPMQPQNLHYDVPSNFSPGQYLSPAVVSSSFPPRSPGAYTPSASSPLIDPTNAFFGSNDVPGPSPVDTSPTNTHYGMWPLMSGRSASAQDDVPRPFSSISTANSSADENSSSAESPSEARESLVSWASGASGSARELLTAEQKRASLQTSWMAPAHRESMMRDAGEDVSQSASKTAGRSAVNDKVKKHHRLVSVFSLTSSDDHSADSTPAVPGPRPRSILSQPSSGPVSLPKPPKLRVNFFGLQSGAGASVSAKDVNPSSEALVGKSPLTPGFDGDNSVDISSAADNSFASSLGSPLIAVSSIDGGNVGEAFTPNLTPTKEKQMDPFATASSPIAAVTRRNRRSIAEEPAMNKPERKTSSSRRRVTLTEDIANMDPAVLHAFTMRMKFRAQAFDGAAWGWEWHKNEDAATKKQVEKAVAAQQTAASKSNSSSSSSPGASSKGGLVASGSLSGKYRGRKSRNVSGTYDGAPNAPGYADHHQQPRRSIFGLLTPFTLASDEETIPPRPTSGSSSLWTKIEHHQGHWGLDADGSSMGVGVGNYDVDEKIPKELRNKLYEMWGFSESGPFFR